MLEVEERFDDCFCGASEPYWTSEAAINTANTVLVGWNKKDVDESSEFHFSFEEVDEEPAEYEFTWNKDVGRSVVDLKGEEATTRIDATYWDDAIEFFDLSYSELFEAIRIHPKRPFPILVDPDDSEFFLIIAPRIPETDE